MNKFSKAASHLLQSPLKAALVVILIILPFSFAAATNTTSFTSDKDGLWEIAATWKGIDPAPSNITNNVEVNIFHNVDAKNVKITNGGTITIYSGGKLSGANLDLNGKDSQIIIERGAVLTFDNFTYDNTGGSEPITITNSDLAALPVTLVYFNVKRASQQTSATTLEWKTASEENNAYFAVEKSLDGKTFTEAGRVAGKNAADGAVYSFEDKNAAGRAYYRLKQVDLDGTFTYSAIVVSSVNQKLAIHGRKVLFNTTFNGKLHLINVSGLTLKTIELKAVNAYELPENLKGLYILQLESGNQIATQRISL